MADDLPITAMFVELVRSGYVAVPTHMEDFRLPGAFEDVPSIIGYATPELPIRTGMTDYAELGQRPQRNIYGPSHSK